MRTIEEIKYKIKHPSDDLFGTTIDLIEFLSYQDAKELLKPEVTEADWSKDVKPLTEETVIAEMKKYMEFALEKAENHRGISASRSIEHFEQWLWLLDDKETLAFAEDEDNYSNYGAPILKRICEKYNFEYPQTSWMQNMAKGLKCHEDCEEDCG